MPGDSLLSTPRPGPRNSQVVPLGFWTEYEPDPNRPGEMVAKDYVKWGRRGDLSYTQIVVKVDRIRRKMRVSDGDEAQDTPEWEGVRDAYAAWKAGQDTPVNGTPLEAWPGLNHTQVRVLRENHYRCVEDVAAISEGELGKVRLPDMRGLRDRAKAFLFAKEGQSQIEDALAKRDAEIEALKQMVSDLRSDRELEHADTAPAKPPRR